MTTQELDRKPNGPPAAAFLAAGIGALFLGLAVTLAEAFPPAEGQVAFWDSARTPGLGSGPGPLAGKVTVGTLAAVVSFAGFGFARRGREVNLRTVLIASGILLALGFALTFPPIFEVFAPPE